MDQAIKRVSPKKDEVANPAPTNVPSVVSVSNKPRPSILSYTQDFLFADEDENNLVRHSTAIGGPLVGSSCEGTFRAEPIRIPLNDRTASSSSLTTGQDTTVIEQSLRKDSVQKSPTKFSISSSKSGLTSPTKRAAPAVARHLPSDSKIAQALSNNGGEEKEVPEMPEILSVRGKKAIFEQAMIKDALAAEKAKNPRKFAQLDADRYRQLPETDSNPTQSKKKKDSNSPSSSPVDMKRTSTGPQLSSTNLTRQKSDTFVRETLKISVSNIGESGTAQSEEPVETRSIQTAIQHGRMNIVSSSSVYRQVCEALSTIDELSSERSSNYQTSCDASVATASRRPSQDDDFAEKPDVTGDPQSFDDNESYNAQEDRRIQEKINSYHYDLRNEADEYDDEGQESEQEQEPTVYQNYPLPDKYVDSQDDEDEREGEARYSPDDNNCQPGDFVRADEGTSRSVRLARVHSIRGDTIYLDPPSKLQNAVDEFQEYKPLKLHELRESLYKEEERYKQAKRALAVCRDSRAADNQVVEAERLFVLHRLRRSMIKLELAKLSNTRDYPELSECARGTVTITEITIPLKKAFMEFIFAENKRSGTVAHFFCTLRCGHQVEATGLHSFPASVNNGKLHFHLSHPVVFSDLTSNFQITLTAHAMWPRKTKQDARTFSNLGGLLTPKRKTTTAPPTHSTLELTSIASNFAEFGYLDLNINTIRQGAVHKLVQNSAAGYPFEENVTLGMEVHLDYRQIRASHLNAFYSSRRDEVTSWHQVWVVLCGCHLVLQTNENMESDNDLINVIDLRKCVSGGAVACTSDMCALYNSFIILTKEDRTVVEQELEKPLKQGNRVCAIRR